MCPQSCMTFQEAIAWSAWPELMVPKYGYILQYVCLPVDSGLFLLQTFSHAVISVR